MVVPLFGAEGHSCAVNRPRHVRHGEGEHGQENDEWTKLFQHGRRQNTNDSPIGKGEFAAWQKFGVCAAVLRLFATPMLYRRDAGPVLFRWGRHPTRLHRTRHLVR